MRYLAVIAAFFVLAVAAGPASAQGHHGHNGHNGHSRHGHEIHGRQSLDRFLPGIRRLHPGRLLDVRPGWGPDGEPHNHIKWLTPDGRVIWLDQDARTGRVVGVESAPRYGPRTYGQAFDPWDE